MRTFKVQNNRIKITKSKSSTLYPKKSRKLKRSINHGIRQRLSQELRKEFLELLNERQEG